MKSIRGAAGVTIFAVLTSVSAFAAQVTINCSSGAQLVKNNLNSNLTGGTTANGDGAVIQIGYYSGGSNANNFSGTWIPLSGNGSANTGNVAANNLGPININQTSIGDFNASGAGNGSFSLQLTFDTAFANKSQNLPSLTSIPLVIRFYNGTTIGSSTFYNAVSNDLWDWVTPSDTVPSISLSLDDPNLEWLGGAGSEFKTSLAVVPEPSVALAGLFSVGLMALRRRRQA